MRRSAKFNRVKKNFALHLKKYGWRYNKTLPDLIGDLNMLASKNKDLMARSRINFQENF